MMKSRLVIESLNILLQSLLRDTPVNGPTLHNPLTQYEVSRSGTAYDPTQAKSNNATQKQRF